jgi:hypothetical protein
MAGRVERGSHDEEAVMNEQNNASNEALQVRASCGCMTTHCGMRTVAMVF